MDLGDDGPIFPDDDDDDEFADLFSFGADMAAPEEPSSSLNKGPSQSPSRKSGLSASSYDDGDDNDSHASNDSFIELLENAHESEISMLDSMGVMGSVNVNEDGTAKKETADEMDLQDILDWLDDDDEKGSELLQRQEEELVFVQPPRPPSLEDSVKKTATTQVQSAPKPKEFLSLDEAVMSREASKSQIRQLLEKEKFVVEKGIRPHLWSKMICDKTLDETIQSSLADSFQQWEENFWDENFWGNSTAKGTTTSQGNDDDEKAQDATDSAEVSRGDSAMSWKQQQREWLEEQSKVYAERILTVVKDGNLEFYRKALLAILVNHFDRGSTSHQIDSTEDEASWKDPLLPPVLCSILSSGVSPPAACVMLGQIIPSFMPILALASKERQEVASILHNQFYLLACYHLPLLALHLDKYLPGWYKCPPSGRLPQSWLISHLAGETGSSSMNMGWLLHLWDLILSSNNNSLRFFLVIAILDFHAERLLLLTDDELKEEFHAVISFASTFDNDSKDDSEGGTSEEEDKKAIKWVQEWSDKAVMFWEETPFAVMQKLKVLEDNAVTDALVARQKAKEEKLRLQQEAEERAMKEAREAEQERKQEEARKRLTRARLVAFYRQYNPGKETNIEKIMISYDGRYDVLDAKLKMKYGVGFNPALKPKPIALTKSNQKIFASMNSGFGQRKSTTKQNDNQNPGLEQPKIEKTVVQVPPSEILPVICWSKDANRIKLSKLKKSSKMVNDKNERNPMKFYLVDSRPEDAASEQGSLPTSVRLSPETLADSKRMIDQEAMFESLRGSVHICIMGEGYASLPKLYNHKVTSELAELIRKDEERNNVCARFFLSRGFPFVSLMEGGFASAHAYLCREGPKVHLHVNNVLIDYDPEDSLFGRLEKLHSMSGVDKAQRALQNLFDSSMTALTKKSMQLETIAAGTLEDNNVPKGGTKSAVKRFFDKNEMREDRKQRQSHGSLRNSFAQKMQTMRDGRNNSSKETVSGSSDLGSLELHDSNLLSSSASSGSSIKKAPVTDQSKGLSGLSSHLQKPQNGPPSPTKGVTTKSPFSRFGGLSIGQNTKRVESSSGPGKPNNFAGSLNKFKTTMARIRTNEVSSEEIHGTTRTVSHSSDSKSPPSSPTSRVRTKQDKNTSELDRPMIAKV